MHNSNPHEPRAALLMLCAFVAMAPSAFAQADSSPGSATYLPGPDVAPGYGELLSWMKSLGVLDADYKKMNDELRATYPRLTDEELADMLIQNTANQAAALGVLCSSTGLLPGVGTKAQLLSLIPELWYVTRMRVTLAFRIAELYGRERSEEEISMEALIIVGGATLVYDLSNALEKGLEWYAQKFLKEKFGSLAAKLFSMSPRLLQKIALILILNPQSVQKILAKFIPFIGMGVSAAANYLSIVYVGNEAKGLASRHKSLLETSADRELAMPRNMHSVLKTMRKMAGVDGTSEAEARVAREFVARYVPTADPETVFENNDRFDEDAIIDDARTLPENVRLMMMKNLLRLEYADGVKTFDEMALHEDIVRRWGLDGSELERILNLMELDAMNERATADGNPNFGGFIGALEELEERISETSAE